MNAILEQSNNASSVSRFMGFFHRVCRSVTCPRVARYRVAPRIGDHQLAERLRHALVRRLRPQDVQLAGETSNRRPSVVP